MWNDNVKRYPPPPQFTHVHGILCAQDLVTYTPKSNTMERLTNIHHGYSSRIELQQVPYLTISVLCALLIIYHWNWYNKHTPLTICNRPCLQLTFWFKGIFSLLIIYRQTEHLGFFSFLTKGLPQVFYFYINYILCFQFVPEISLEKNVSDFIVIYSLHFFYLNS